MNGASSEDERERLVAAVAAVLAEKGFVRFTTDDVVKAAGLPPETFYEHFPDKLAAVLVAHQEVFEPFFRSITMICQTPRTWPVRVTTAIGTTLEFATDQPDRAQLLTVEAFTQNAEVAREVLESTDRLARLLSNGRRLSEAAAQLPALTEKALVGAISSIVYSHLLQGEAAQLPSLKRPLAEFILLPYVGPSLAARVAAEQT
jgi:AcrR family transcriptional regulator